MRAQLVLLLVCGVCVVLPLPLVAGVFTTTTYHGDSDSGITTQYTYTHAIDFGTGETINGVPFAADSGANRVTYQYDVLGATSSGTAATDNVSGSSNTLESRYIYDATPGQDTTVILKGLTVGYTYTTTFYDIGSGSPGTQYVAVRDGDATRYVYDENSSGLGNGTLLRDTFTATRTQYTYTFTTTTNPLDSNPGDPNNTSSNSTFYLYGLSNQLVATPEPATSTLLGSGLFLLALAGCRCKRGPWAKTPCVSAT